MTSAHCTPPPSYLLVSSNEAILPGLGFLGSWDLRRAALAAGFPPGLAEEAGPAGLWLCDHGLDGVAVVEPELGQQRRAAGEPLQYVVGSWGFRRLDLMVDPRALIPRPETETVAPADGKISTGRGYSQALPLSSGDIWT